MSLKLNAKIMIMGGYLWEKRDGVLGQVIIFITVIFGILSLVGVLVGMPIVYAYNKSHYSEQVCKVTKVEEHSGGTPKSGGSGRVDIESSNCDKFEMRKTVEGESISDVAQQVKPGREYKFQFGDIQLTRNPATAQKFEELH